jgi:EasF-like predicted methyltransferase
LLQAFERAGKDVDYYALDLSRPELERTLAQIGGVYQHVHCHGLFGTYDDGLAWLKKPGNLEKPKCILWMGSSIGNLTRPEAADFLKGFSQVLNSQDRMLIGIDACQDKEKVYRAYNDSEGKTYEFDLNGLAHANRLLGKKVFIKSDWKVIGEYDENAGRHQAFYVPVRDVVIDGIHIQAGERIRFEESYKYSLLQSGELWQHAGLIEQARFGTRLNEYRKWISSVARICQHYLSSTSPLHTLSTAIRHATLH